MSNLQTIAKRCPIMSKALAVQSVRNHSTGSVLGGFSKSSPRLSANTVQKRAYVAPSNMNNFQVSSKKDAQASSIESVHMKAGVFDTSKGVF